MGESDLPPGTVGMALSGVLAFVFMVFMVYTNHPTVAWLGIFVIALLAVAQRFSHVVEHQANLDYYDD